MKLRSKTFFQKLSRPAVGFVKFRILHVDDTPQRIARGVAVGVWIAFTPLLGLHMILALAIAALILPIKPWRFCLSGSVTHSLYCRFTARPI